MAISIVGSAAVAGSSITIPTTTAGDDIVVAAFNGIDTTTPSKPAAGGTVPNFVDISANSGGNGCAMRVCHAVATGTSHTSGTWGADAMAVIVLRGQDASPIGGHAESGGSGAEAVAPAIALANTDGTSVLLEFHGHVNTETWGGAPSGYTRRAAVGSARASGLCINTKDTTTSDGAVTQTITAGSPGGYRGATVEVVTSGSPAPPPAGTGMGAAIWFR